MDKTMNDRLMSEMLGQFQSAQSKCYNHIYLQRDGGKWLVGVDEAPDVTLSVWDWSKGVKQIETKVILKNSSTAVL